MVDLLLLVVLLALVPSKLDNSVRAVALGVHVLHHAPSPLVLRVLLGLGGSWLEVADAYIIWDRPHDLRVASQNLFLLYDISTFIKRTGLRWIWSGGPCFICSRFCSNLAWSPLASLA